MSTRRLPGIVTSEPPGLGIVQRQPLAGARAVVALVAQGLVFAPEGTMVEKLGKFER